MEKIILIGAGSAMFTRGLLADLIRSELVAEVALVDTDPVALSVAEGLAAKMIAARQARLTLSASTDRRQVLSGATLVICTIGVGGRRAWEKDVFVPREFGIHQPVGDSVLPGGTSRALRMIPAMVAIAKDVLDLCPQAILVNYGNPMGPVCRAVRRATGAQIIGLCHGVHDVGRYLARELGVDSASLRYSAVGLNHLTWFVEVRSAGQDMLPRMRQIAESKMALGQGGEMARLARQGGGDAILHQTTPFAWQLLLQFGGFPAALDRHVTEFFPQFFAAGDYYGLKLGHDAYSFEACIANGDRIYSEMRALASSPDPLPEGWFAHAGGEHEQVVDILQSIRRDDGRVYSANLPNRGQVPNLPAEAIIEAPAMACATGLKPIQQAPLPAGIVGCMATRLAWVEVVVEAALEGDRDKVVQALILDGAVSSVEQARSLAQALLEAQSDHLPQFAHDVSR